MTQLPPSRSTRSWRASISSISPVMLKANIAFLPLRSAWRRITAITALTRSAKGQCGGSAMSSSSLMKSMPPSTSLSTSSAVSAGVSPTLGLMMVPISGRSADAGERARAGNAELRALVGAKQRRRQVEIEEAQSRDLAALEEVARDRGKDVRDGGAGVGERPGDRHLGAAEAALGWTCHRQARLLALVELGDALDPRRMQALDALGRRAGELDEGRGRGLARDHRRGLGKLDVGLDQVGGGEAVAHGSGPA